MFMRRIRSIVMLVALLGVSLMMFACEAKITSANYEKITTGMSRSAVEKLLGGKGDDETATGGTSITGAGLADDRKVKDIVFRWRDGNKQIVVTFRDDKVFAKAQEGL